MSKDQPIKKLEILLNCIVLKHGTRLTQGWNRGGLMKKPARDWHGKTRSTLVNPTETRLFLYIYKMTSFLALAFYYQLTKSFALQREDRITIHRIRNPNLFNLQSS